MLRLSPELTLLELKQELIMQKVMHLHPSILQFCAYFVGADGANDNTGTTPASAVDWYDQQTLGLTNSVPFTGKL